jgi:hypothetical protein
MFVSTSSFLLEIGINSRANKGNIEGQSIGFMSLGLEHVIPQSY